jgi:hypothetical protein
MDVTKLNQLREMAESTDGEIDRGLVLELIAAHETQQRAESFWSVRAPALADEVMILRQVEEGSRAVRVALSAALAQAAERMSDALGELDALRAKQAGA